MSTRHIHQDYPVHPAGHHTLCQRQARRRQLLGILLIVVGSLWLFLRLTGQVPSPSWWMEGMVAMLEGFSTGDLVLSWLQAACGMLAP